MNHKKQSGGYMNERFLISFLIRIKNIIFLLILIVNISIHSQNKISLVDKVILDESRTRYYLHYDRYGNYPEELGSERLKDNIRAGDEIVVRFYPNSIFKLDLSLMDMPKPTNELNSFIIYPYAQKDTFSIQYGYGEVYFATNTTGAYELRIASKTTSMDIGAEADLSLIQKDVGKYNLNKEENFEEILKNNGYGDKWKVWVFKNIYFEKGIYCIEVFQRSGGKIKLLARTDAVQATDIYENSSTIIQNDISNSTHLPLEKAPANGFYQSIINSVNTVAGILSFNIIYNFSKDSWDYHQAPGSAFNRKLFYNDQSIIINKLQELPNSIRIRAGFGVLNNLREVRLISNFVLVMNPKRYFNYSTPLLYRINPTLGLQVGGTGDKDIVFLMGLSIKLINEGDLVTGFRFNGDNNKWQIGRNFYFGITLDPGLFGQLTNK